MKNCGQCGAQIPEKYVDGSPRGSMVTYCSRSCSNAARRAPTHETLLNDSVRNFSTGCWEWDGYRDRKGYGRMSETDGEVLAHRISWVFHNKRPVPPEMHVMHKCDNPRCINPDHLTIGTNADNQADKIAKGRHKGAVGEVNGRAKLTVEQVRKILSDTRSHEDIASDYGVAQSTVSRIKRGEGWKNVARAA